MLKPDHITRNYSIKLLVPSCLPRGGCRGRDSEALIIVTTYYYTLLQQLLLHCYFIHADISCWLFLTSCCKTRRKLLVFDRPSIFPLTLVLLSCSTLYSLPFLLIQVHAA